MARRAPRDYVVIDDVSPREAERGQVRELVVVRVAKREAASLVAARVPAVAELDAPLRSGHLGRPGVVTEPDVDIGDAEVSIGTVVDIGRQLDALGRRILTEPDPVSAEHGMDCERSAVQPDAEARIKQRLAPRVVTERRTQPEVERASSRERAVVADREAITVVHAILLA